MFDEWGRFSLLLVHQYLWETAVQKKIPEAAGARALRLRRHSAACRREAGRRLHRVEVRGAEEQSRKVSGALNVGGRRRGGVGADGGVRQGGGQSGGGNGEELQLANRAAAILPATGRAGRCEQATPLLLMQVPPFNQPLRAERQRGVSHPLSQGHQTLSCRTGRRRNTFILKSMNKRVTQKKNFKPVWCFKCKEQIYEAACLQEKKCDEVQKCNFSRRGSAYSSYFNCFS